MSEPLVSVQVVVRNGQRYLRDCLDAIRKQTYPNCEVVILDNASTDTTADIITREYPEFMLNRGTQNLGMWPGHEHLMSYTHGPYILAVSIDVVLDPNFIERAVTACEHDSGIAAIQGKIYQQGTSNRIDTCGFALARSRKVINVGHGELDSSKYATTNDIFGVEGAVPFFRRSALEDCRIDGHIWDPDYFWYGDDLDLAWRMTLFGHRQVFLPEAIAWHDRSTTKAVARIPIIGQLKRISERREIPIKKRRLDWSNVRFTIIKNDSILSILKDAPFIVAREVAVLGYTVLFEPSVLAAAYRFIRLLPTMLRRRRIIMQRSK